MIRIIEDHAKGLLERKRTSHLLGTRKLQYPPTRGLTGSRSIATPNVLPNGRPHPTLSFRRISISRGGGLRDRQGNLVRPLAFVVLSHLLAHGLDISDAILCRSVCLCVNVLIHVKNQGCTHFVDAKPFLTAPVGSSDSVQCRSTRNAVNFPAAPSTLSLLCVSCWYQKRTFQENDNCRKIYI